MPLLRGTDGDQKMSKSYDNYIGISEPPEEQYGKTMSIPDDLLAEWFELASGLTGDDLAAALDQVKNDPYEAKRSLAWRITETYHGTEGAQAGRDHFNTVFRKKEDPDEMPEVAVRLGHDNVRYDDGAVWVPGLLVAAGLATSNSEATRLIEQGAVAVDGETVEDRNATVSAEAGQERVLRRGKRKFARVRFIDE
jgi:tyrosyl-tRNA synthetase